MKRPPGSRDVRGPNQELVICEYRFAGEGAVSTERVSTSQRRGLRHQTGSPGRTRLAEQLCP